MSVRLSFDLKRDTLKAQVVPPDKPDLTYLIDTGADTPVWCKGKDELIDVFPQADKIDSKFLLGGFGKEPELVDVFRIPQFVLTDGDASIVYRNLILAVTDRPSMGVDFILPASIFNHMRVVVDRISSVVNPKLEIESEKDDIMVFFRRIDLSKNQKERLGVDVDIIVQNVYAKDDVHPV